MGARGSKVVVIGGANIDIAGRAAGSLAMRDSNIGTVRISHGGVARNIAHNLALLGCEAHLVAPFGEDALSDDLARGCLEAGIRLEHSFKVAGGSASTYLYIMGADGEMELAINDMGIVGEITCERLEERLGLIEDAEVCVIDANLEPEVLAWVGEHVSAPLFSDPISCAKAPRLSGLLGRLHTFKPNEMEAALITGCADAGDAARAILAQGARRVFVSRGTRGVFCADAEAAASLPCPPAKVVSATGAGDAMLAGLVWAHLEGLGLEESGWAGLAASAICVESSQTVNPHLGEATLRARMEELI